MHLVRAGGGFGRRLHSEYDIEVAKIARVVADERAAAGQPSVPVKLLWTREDDMAHDNYRPGGFHYFKAGLDASGKTDRFPRFRRERRVRSVPANEFPRDSLPNFRCRPRQITPFNIPTGALRAPSTNGVSFVMQSFIDEIAVAAGKDPLQYRMDSTSRTRACSPPAAAPVHRRTPRWRWRRLQRRARHRRSGSGARHVELDYARGKLPSGTGMGVAFQFAHAGYVAYVVEAAVDAQQENEDQQGLVRRRYRKPDRQHEHGEEPGRRRIRRRHEPHDGLGNHDR